MLAPGAVVWRGAGGFVLEDAAETLVVSANRRMPEPGCMITRHPDQSIASRGTMYRIVQPKWPLESCKSVVVVSSLVAAKPKFGP